MVITANTPSYTSFRKPVASVGGQIDNYQVGAQVEPPPPGYDPTSPGAMKVNGVAAIGLVGGLAGLIGGLAGGMPGAIGGALALGAAGFALGRFAGLSYDITHLGSTNVAGKASWAGAALGAVGGALAGAGSGSVWGAVALGLAGGIGGAWGSAMVIDP